MHIGFYAERMLCTWASYKSSECTRQAHRNGKILFLQQMIENLRAPSLEDLPGGGAQQIKL